MPITSLNHAVLYVRNAEASAVFYSEVLGFKRLPFGLSGAVFMQAPGSTNDHDLGLFSIGEGAFMEQQRRYMRTIPMDSSSRSAGSCLLT